MKNALKSISKILAITLIFGIASGINKTYAAETLPKVDRILGEYRSLYEGDTQTFDFLVKGNGKFQYRFWLCNRKTGKWQDITKGYSSPVDSNKIYSVITPKLQEGDYGISVWVKRVGKKPKDKRGFDSYLGISMKCLKKNGQTSNSNISMKSNYSLGENINIGSIKSENITYSCSIYDILNKKCIENFGPYKNIYSWKADKEGLYLLTSNIRILEKVPVDKNISEKIYKDDNINKKEEKLDKQSIVQDKDSQQIKTDIKLNENSIDKKEEDINLDNKNNINKDKDTNDIKENEKDDKEKSTTINNKDNKLKEDILTLKDSKKSDKKVKILYKYNEKNTSVAKLIIIGNPFKQNAIKKPTNSLPLTSLVVGNAGENQIIFIKSSPKPNAGSIGHIYGSLQSVKILKSVGNYYYIETTDYNSLKTIKGYILKSQVKIVSPSGPYSIVIDLSEQKVKVFKNGKLDRIFICSTGQNSTPTPKGIYLVGDRGSSFNTGADKTNVCYNWVRFNHNFLFHSLIYNKYGQLIQYEAKRLGNNVSHGCVRLRIENAKWIYDNIPRETVVTVQD